VMMPYMDMINHHYHYQVVFLYSYERTGLAST
jgi:hypothetical protein